MNVGELRDALQGVLDAVDALPDTRVTEGWLAAHGRFYELAGESRSPLAERVGEVLSAGHAMASDLEAQSSRLQEAMNDYIETTL